MATSARLEQVVANAKATERRRRALADEFRASLLAEIGPVGYSVIRRALVENAVSAYVEVSELSARFQRGRATESALTRLGLARGQLTRALRLLGGFDVALDANTLPPGATAEEQREHARRYVSRAYADAVRPPLEPDRA